MMVMMVRVEEVIEDEDGDPDDNYLGTKPDHNGDSLKNDFVFFPSVITYKTLPPEFLNSLAGKK